MSSASAPDVCKGFKPSSSPSLGKSSAPEAPANQLCRSRSCLVLKHNRCLEAGLVVGSGPCWYELGAAAAKLSAPGPGRLFCIPDRTLQPHSSKGKFERERCGCYSWQGRYHTLYGPYTVHLSGTGSLGKNWCMHVGRCFLSNGPETTWLPQGACFQPLHPLGPLAISILTLTERLTVAEQSSGKTGSVRQRPGRPVSLLLLSRERRPGMATSCLAQRARGSRKALAEGQRFLSVVSW